LQVYKIFETYKFMNTEILDSRWFK